jgi:hypothetical protein
VNKNILFLIVVIAGNLLFFSCAGFQKSLYSTFVNEESGDKVLEEQIYVRAFLEDVLSEPEEYTVAVYERNVLKSQKNRTKFLTHSYFVIKKPVMNEYHTVSFYGSRISPKSQGSWTMDSSFDTASYNGFLSGKNKWDVIERINESNIDTAETAQNIIRQIDEGVVYYYYSHIKKKGDMENCNTALYNALVPRKKILVISP